ncbi:hypothetical protein [Aliamphritea spongicola]|uniref:hypothetical protein n=1 Tax=Aliamphritea spongicola TaxID=707589 RepID=UPI00196B46E0|nr:hypothetical protein [Aliamphritea spongicola]MBN3563000.1 hypothetical protein [Aliamphritea spongicola]
MSFSGAALATPDLNEAADDVCACMEAPYAQIEQAMEMLNAAQASGDTSALIAAQGEMLGVINAASQCFNELSVKYPEISQSQDLQQQVMAIADDQCPNPADAMFSNQ